MKGMFDFRQALQTLKEDFSKKNISKTIFHLLLLVVGSAVLAAGDEFFLINSGIVSGGMSGIGVLFNKALGWDANTVITVGQWIFFLIGFLLLGPTFALRTLVSTIVYPIFLFVFARVLSEESVASFFAINSGVADLDMLIAGSIGGLLCGLGCGITYQGGGSTGGVDNISLSISKYAHIKASVTSFIVDVSIVLSVMFFEQNIVPVLIGSFSAFCCAFAIEKVYIGVNETYIAMIISDKWEKINEIINKELSRGTTLFDGYGGYTGEDKVLIQVAFTKDEYDELLRIIYQNDKKAFLTVTKASEVTGYGFRKVPFKINREIVFAERSKKRAHKGQKENLKIIKNGLDKPVEEKKTNSQNTAQTGYNKKVSQEDSTTAKTDEKKSD